MKNYYEEDYAVMELANGEVVKEYGDVGHELGRCVLAMTNKDIVSATVRSGGFQFIIETKHGTVTVKKERA